MVLTRLRPFDLMERIDWGEEHLQICVLWGLIPGHNFDCGNFASPADKIVDRESRQIVVLDSFSKD